MTFGIDWFAPINIALSDCNGIADLQRIVSRWWSAEMTHTAAFGTEYPGLNVIIHSSNDTECPIQGIQVYRKATSDPIDRCC